jgi:hypothetical protein
VAAGAAWASSPGGNTHSGALPRGGETGLSLTKGKLDSERGRVTSQAGGAAAAVEAQTERGPGRANSADAPILGHLL